MIPYTIQGVILSVSILSLYVGTKSILSNRLVMLVGAYCVVILPYIYQGIRNGMRAVNMTTLIEAAEMLGASKIYAFSELSYRIFFQRSLYHHFWPLVLSLATMS